MADLQSSIFNKKATEKLRTPDDLDKYIRVTNPSVWVVLAACIALIAGVVAWGVFGSVSTSITCTGVVIDGEAMCYLSAEDMSKVHDGDSANVGGEVMRVKSVAPVPSSREEAHEVLRSDYLVSSLMSGDWAYAVAFDGDVSDITEEVPVSITITVERIAPITLVLGSQG